MTATPAPRRRLERGARLVAQAILIGLGVALIVFAVQDWSLSDASAYWQAAGRVRGGEPLYPEVADIEGSSVYRYAPWFAFAAVPFTFLPIEIAAALWSLILIGASALAVVPLLQSRQVVPAFFFGSVLIGISAIGNAQPLIVAALVWGVERRSGPFWIAATASLKAVPILFAVVYLGRREWWRFAATLALTGLLVAPFLAYDLTHYVTDAGDAGMLIQLPVVYTAVVAVGIGVTLRMARGPFGWLSAATTAALALPRFFVYDITFLLPGSPADGRAGSTNRLLRMDQRVATMPRNSSSSKEADS